METRFLIDDLNLELQDQEKVSADLNAHSLQLEPAGQRRNSRSIRSGDKQQQSDGGVTVDINSIKNQNALSGSVTFSDVSEWYVDPR